jgi:hypothetical protein
MIMNNPLQQRNFQARRKKKKKKKTKRTLPKGQRHWEMRTVSVASR